MKISKLFVTIIVGDDMNILEINLRTLSNLYEQFPESFKDLSMNGDYLVYNDEQVDISKFNINDFFNACLCFCRICI